MLSKKSRAILPTVGFILVAVIVSVFLLNYFNINVADNGGLRILNRKALFEGNENMNNKNNNKNKNNKKTKEQDDDMEMTENNH